MSDTSSRATFSSLRARREAYQIASDILYEEPIDIRTVACQACGEWIDVHASTIVDPLTCLACGAKTPLPSYLRAKFMSRRVAPPKPLHYFPANEPISLTGEPAVFGEEPMVVPRWLIWLNAILVPLGIGTAIALLFR